MKTEKINNKAYTLGTAKEIGKLVEQMMVYNNDDFHFPDFSMAISADYNETDNLADISHKSEGWYGAREFDAGFNGDMILTVCFDYYGGGCAHLVQLWEDEIGNDKFTANAITTAILDTLGIQEVVHEDTQIIVEWDMDKYIDMQKRIWMRVGMEVKLTDQEFDELMNAAKERDCTKLYSIFESMIKRGELNGETYIVGRENGGVENYDNPEHEISVQF